MQYKKLSGGQLVKAGYDERESVLEVHLNTGSIKRFKAVQPEVFRRLVDSPNPASFYEDRIVEEYAVDNSRATSSDSAQQKLDDLFG